MAELSILAFMLAGGVTKRFHTVPTIIEHTVGHHSFGVACLAYLLSGRAPSANLLMAAITHDMAEQYVGDIPSPTKRSLPAMKELLDSLENSHLDMQDLDFDLTPDEQRVLKLADIFEGMWSCYRERMLGNRSIDVAYANFKSYACKMILQGVEMDVFNELDNLYRKAKL